MRLALLIRSVIFNTVIIKIAADFPLENPCLQTCSNSDSDITATTLQTCIDKCLPNGHCCGNRLNGECPASSNQRLSCANGCEIAFYRSTVDQCKQDCQAGNVQECFYSHPNIAKDFNKCGSCSNNFNNCTSWPTLDACSQGCDLAATIPEFYQYVEVPPGSCDHDNIPRFLFGGQSNMEGKPEDALPNSFIELIRIVNKKKEKKKVKRQLKKLLIQAKASEKQTTSNEASLIYKMRKYLKKKKMYNDHPTSSCSFTNPKQSDELDCERPISSTACGANHDQYGPEFMFGHVFPKLNSPLKGQAIGIAKIAVGGTEIYSDWMKDNKDNSDNYWNALVDTIQGAKGSLEAFVWFQGENDSFADWNKENYLPNLTKFVADVRQEIVNESIKNESIKFQSPADVPVIIVECGRWIWGVDTAVIEAQRAFVAADSNAVLVPTGAGDEIKEQLTKMYHYDIAAQLIIGKRIAEAMAQILNDNENV